MRLFQLNQSIFNCLITGASNLIIFALLQLINIAKALDPCHTSSKIALLQN